MIYLRTKSRIRSWFGHGVWLILISVYMRMNTCCYFIRLTGFWSNSSVQFTLRLKKYITEKERKTKESSHVWVVQGCSQNFLRHFGKVEKVCEAYLINLRCSRSSLPRSSLYVLCKLGIPSNCRLTSMSRASENMTGTSPARSTFDDDQVTLPNFEA